MSKIVYVPLDERPSNAKYPKLLAAITDIEFISPPASMLGVKKQPASAEEIGNWLLREAADADYAIVSMDMLVYGGIVPSRLHQLSPQQCAGRIDVLREMKRLNPFIRIYAFNLVMRAPAYDSSNEESDYYERYGESIFRYGWLRDKSATEALTEEERHEWETLQAGAIPSTALDDFLRRRAVNAKVNELAVSLVNEGIIEHLVIPFDDNAVDGFSPMEQRKLLLSMEQHNLMDRVLIYPGSDEVGCILLAKVFCRMKQYTPEAAVRYSSTLGSTTIPKYENRSLHESVKSHLTSGGARIGDSADSADFVLMVHSPPVSQHDVAESPNPYHSRHRADFSEIHYTEFVTAIEALADKGKLVALADVASCNGADHTLMRLLSKKQLLSRITAYSAWNTSGNSLGTVIAHAIIASYYRSQPSRPSHTDRISSHFYLYRLIEDWGYQTNPK